MDKRHIYIVLTRTNTVISKLIRMFMKDEYTHAAIALDRELKNMYSFGRKYVYNPFLGCFKREAVDRGVYKLHKEVPSVIMEVEVSDQQYEKVQCLIRQFICNSHLYKYNYGGLLQSLLNMEVCEANRFLCSEFVYHILKESGIADLHMSRNLVRPQSLLALKCNIFFKGDLKLFNRKENYYIAGKDCMKGLSAVYE